MCQKCAQHGEECEGYGAQRLAFRNYTASVQRKRGLAPPTTPLHSITLEFLGFLDLNREDLVVLKEFVESLSPELALTESHNIWRDDIAPLISDGRERHLLHALLAVTVMHRTHLEHRITYDAAMHYDVAVSDLRVALDAVDRRPGQLDSVLATLFLLTWFEVG